MCPTMFCYKVLVFCKNYRNVRINIWVKCFMGLASLVLALLPWAFLVFGSGPIGTRTFITLIIFWVIALSIGISSAINNRGQKIIKSNKAAFAGIIVSIISIVMTLLMPAINLAASHSWRGRFFCKKNLSAIYGHLENYTNSYDGYLPDGDSWCDILIRGSGVKLQKFACPTLTAPTQQSSYALNKAIFGVRLSDIPEETVLVFETELSWNSIGGIENMNYENHNGYCGVLKVNGEVVFVSPSEANALKW